MNNNNNMDAAKEYTKDYAENSGRRPFISFGDMQEHTMKLVSDERAEIDDANNPGKKVQGVRFVVEADGMEQEFFTGSIGLIQKLSACNPGDVVTIKQVKGKNASGAFRTGYEVKRGGESVQTESEQAAADPEAPEAPKGW